MSSIKCTQRNRTSKTYLGGISAYTASSPRADVSHSSITNNEIHNPNDEFKFSTDVNDYELGKIIGYGSSALVHVGRYKLLNKQVAIKVFDLESFERDHIDELRKEIQIMSLSRHPNLLPVYGSVVNESKLYIFMPLHLAGSCLDIMRTCHPHGFDEPNIGAILIQALEGLSYLHENGLIHRDVKAGNLLVGQDGIVQLADFGVSSSLMEKGERKGLRKTFAGTPCWMAPEVMEQSGYSFSADIWSLGITALELANGKAPFAKYPPMKILMLTLKKDPPTLDRSTTKHKFSKTFKDMIDSCLSKDPEKRPSSDKLLQHSFFKQTLKRNISLVHTLLKNLKPITERNHKYESFAPPKNDDDIFSPSNENSLPWDFEYLVDGSSVSNSNNSVTNSQFSPHEVPNDANTKKAFDSYRNDIKFDDVNTNLEVLSHNSLTKKKSRFFVDSNNSANETQQQCNVNTQHFDTNTSPSTNSNHSTRSVNMTSLPTPPQLVAASNQSMNQELRKGRFCVNSNPPSSSSPPLTIKNQSYLANSGIFSSSLQTGLKQHPKVHSVHFAASTLPLYTAHSTISHVSSRPTLQSHQNLNSPSATVDKRGRFEVSKNCTIPESSIALPNNLPLYSQATTSGIFLQPSEASPAVSKQSTEQLLPQIPTTTLPPIPGLLSINDQIGATSISNTPLTSTYKIPTSTQLPSTSLDSSSDLVDAVLNLVSYSSVLPAKAQNVLNQNSDLQSLSEILVKYILNNNSIDSTNVQSSTDLLYSLVPSNLHSLLNKIIRNVDNHSQL